MLWSPTSPKKSTMLSINLVLTFVVAWSIVGESEGMLRLPTYAELQQTAGYIQSWAESALSDEQLTRNLISGEYPQFGSLGFGKQYFIFRLASVTAYLEVRQDEVRLFNDIVERVLNSDKKLTKVPSLKRAIKMVFQEFAMFVDVNSSEKRERALKERQSLAFQPPPPEEEDIVNDEIGNVYL